MEDDQDFNDVWDRSVHDAEPQDSSEDGETIEVEIGPPIRVTILIRAETVPVAPWAQGWRIAAAGPSNGQITLLFEHDVDASPVAQLAAVTGLFSTVAAAQLEIVWWAIQTRGPIPGEKPEEPSLEDELSALLENPTPAPEDPDED